MRTQAIAASHKMSQTNSKDFCFVHCDVMLPWKWLLWMHVARAQCTALIEASWNNLNFSITVEIEVAKWGKQFHLGNKMFASLHFLTRAPVCLPMTFKSIHNDLANCSFLVFFLFILRKHLTVNWYKVDTFAEKRRTIVPPPPCLSPFRSDPLVWTNQILAVYEEMCDYNTEQATNLATIVLSFSPTHLRPP